MFGPHPDDIEIGCGGTLLTWIARGTPIEIDWVVFSASGLREGEARRSAAAFLKGATASRVSTFDFRDGFFPYQGVALKERFEALKREIAPDVVLTHRRDDAHQDHRELAQLTWNTFRDHVILEYEIPKWDGDIARPNLYQPLTRAALDRKIALLHEHFATQRAKDWFDEETFRALARLRGMESRASERAAEAFVLHKAVLA